MGIFSNQPMHNLRGELVGAHLYMEVKIFGGEVKPLRVYADSFVSAEAYLHDYVRYAPVGHWSISTIDARSGGFMVAHKGDYGFERVAEVAR